MKKNTAQQSEVTEPLEEDIEIDSQPIETKTGSGLKAKGGGATGSTRAEKTGESEWHETAKSWKGEGSRRNSTLKSGSTPQASTSAQGNGQGNSNSRKGSIVQDSSPGKPKDQSKSADSSSMKTSDGDKTKSSDRSRIKDSDGKKTKSADRSSIETSGGDETKSANRSSIKVIDGDKTMSADRSSIMASDMDKSGAEGSSSDNDKEETETGPPSSAKQRASKNESEHEEGTTKHKEDFKSEIAQNYEKLDAVEEIKDANNRVVKEEPPVLEAALSGPSQQPRSSFFNFFQRKPASSAPPLDEHGLTTSSAPPPKIGLKLPFFSSATQSSPSALRDAAPGDGPTKPTVEPGVTSSQSPLSSAGPPSSQKPSFVERFKGVFRKQFTKPHQSAPSRLEPHPSSDGFQPAIESRKTSQQPPTETYPVISSGDTRRTWASSAQRNANLIPLDIPQTLGTPSSALTNQTFRQLEPGIHRENEGAPSGFTSGASSGSSAGKSAEGRDSLTASQVVHQKDAGPELGDIPDKMAARKATEAGSKGPPNLDIQIQAQKERGATFQSPQMSRRDVRPIELSPTEVHKAKLMRHLRHLKCLAFCLVFLGVIFLILCSFNIFNCTNPPPLFLLHKIEGTTTCETEGCGNFVAHFSETMLSSVDPCEDFYEHVCGGWIYDRRVPVDKVLLDVRTETQRAIDDKIIEQLQAIGPGDTNQNAVQKSAALYGGCINMELRNAKGTKPLENLLDHFGIPKWPIVHKEFQLNVMSTVADMIREINLYAIVSMRVGPDYHDTQKNIIYIGQPDLGVERAVLRARFRSPYFRILHRYKLYMYRCSHILGGTAATAPLIDEIVVFQSKLAAITEEDLPNSRGSFQIITLKSLETATPPIKWTSFVNQILKDVAVLYDTNDRVVVKNVKYFWRLSQLLQETPRYVVANYLAWRVIHEMAPFTVERMRMARFRFDRYRYNTLETEPLAHQCYALMARYMHFAVGRIFYDLFNTEQTFERKSKVKEIAQELKDAFAVWVDIAGWMTAANKKTAEFKLREMKVNGGFPLWIKSDSDLNEYYNKTPHLKQASFFEAIRHVLKEDVSRNLRRLKTFGHQNDFGWVETQPQADPTYQYLGNFILLPEVYTRSPFLRTDVSPSLNFGALGSIIGRYIIRGFGGYGSLYNSKGELDDWWSPSTRRNYLQETRCFSSQIQWFTNPFTGEELQFMMALDWRKLSTLSTKLAQVPALLSKVINGSIHEDTLVSDNAALKSAYKAYKVYMTKYEEIYKTIIIEGLDWYTQDQIFFISYAMTMCEKVRRRSLYFFLQATQRIPNHYRTNLPLMNFERFAEAFNCPLGSPMNPELKCDVY